jgi:Secretion system C-terminal sorting domain/Cellulase (glycosyl hydrolase family 5)
VADINGVFADVEAWSVANNVPVVLGEFGCSTGADATSRCNWVQTLTSAAIAQGFPYIYWDVLSTSDGFGFYTGGVVAQGNVITCFAAAIGLYNTPLATELSTLEADCNDDLPVLVWEAAFTSADTRFEIESSIDGINWEQVGSMMADQGSALYRWRDTAKSNFYRLHISDATGHASYSPIVASACMQDELVQIYPNPAHDRIYVHTDHGAQISIFDLSGRLVATAIADAAANAAGATRVSTSALVSGTYYARVTNALGDVQMLPFVVVR